MHSFPICLSLCFRILFLNSCLCEALSLQRHEITEKGDYLKQHFLEMLKCTENISSISDIQCQYHFSFEIMLGFFCVEHPELNPLSTESVPLKMVWMVNRLRSLPIHISVRWKKKKKRKKKLRTKPNTKNPSSSLNATQKLKFRLNLIIHFKQRAKSFWECTE